MNVEIGTEAAQFPGKEYINGIFVAVCNVKLNPFLESSILAICHLSCASSRSSALCRAAPSRAPSSSASRREFSARSRRTSHSRRSRLVYTEGTN